MSMMLVYRVYLSSHKTQSFQPNIVVLLPYHATRDRNTPKFLYLFRLVMSAI